MGLDARIRYTKMVIKESFVSLLKEKPLNKITVKEICEMAQINRATFYKYYADAFDLMDKIEDEILLELNEIIKKSSQSGIINTLIQILERMKDNGKLYVTLFSENGDSGFSMKIFKMCYTGVEEQNHKKYPQLTEKQRAWIYVYTAQGSSGIMNYWISDGMVESPKEIADFIERLISSTLKNIVLTSK